eukprot:29060-Pelagococcus_subviridis.AAC.6
MISRPPRHGAAPLPARLDTISASHAFPTSVANFPRVDAKKSLRSFPCSRSYSPAWTIISSLSRSFTSFASSVTPSSYSCHSASISSPPRSSPSIPRISRIAPVSIAAFSTFVTGSCGVMSPTIASARS